jgi:anaerobic magnesium-protoporphyrin IX monomethyl ester cyclase
MRWYTKMGRRVWPHEIRGFLRDRRLSNGPTVAQFWGASQEAEEESMSAVRPERIVGIKRAA